MVNAFVGLGANVGVPEQQIREAISALARLPFTRLIRQSTLYWSPPWGLISQPAFVNAVAEISTELAAEELLAALLRIERDAGRERAERWGPRLLDLDLLLYGDVLIDLPGLRVPHPHMHERGFVLLPLAEIAPELYIPGYGRATDLLQAVDCAGIKALG